MYNFLWCVTQKEDKRKNVFPMLASIVGKQGCLVSSAHWYVFL